MSRGGIDKKRLGLTLDELEEVVTPRPTRDYPLFDRVYRLRKKPIGEFTSGDLRIMICHNEGLFYLVPLALELLRSDPLTECDFYPGDLLVVVLESEPSYWRRHFDQCAEVDRILAAITEIPEELEEGVAEWRRWTTGA